MYQWCKTYVNWGTALICAFALCLFAASTARVYGQSSSTGTLSGVVTDNSGAAVPAATITLTHTSTGSVRTTKSGKTGQYIFAFVEPGTYNVSVSKDGFKTATFTNQVVRLGSQLTVNAVMQVGAVSTTVTVTSTPGADLQTLNATVGTSVDQSTLLNLPNASRDATTIATLQPGTDQFGNTAGAVEDQNSFQLDGGYATDDMGGDTNTYIASNTSNVTGVSGQFGMYNESPSAIVPTPVSSIQEFKVSTSNQTADFNGGGGSQVQMVTKRGTNTFHGTVYEYYLDNNFGGANTWDNNSSGFKQPSSHFNRFGAAAGGKVPHSNFLGGSWYIFGNYEGYRFPQSSVYERTFPTAALRAGLIHLNGAVVNLNPFPVVDPGCGSGAAGCKITTTGQTIQPTVCPSGPCDPRGLGTTENGLANGTPNPVINLWNTYLPQVNDCNQGDGSNYCGYKGGISTPTTSNFGVVRVDHDFAKNWHFNATYHIYKLNKASSGQWDIGGFFPGDTKGTYAAVRSLPQRPWIYTAGMTTDISPTLTNDFHWSYTRNWWAYADPGGVPNVAGYAAALEVGGETAGVFGPYNSNNQSTRTRFWDGKDWMYRDDVTWIHGNHLLQFGGMYLRNHDIHQRNDNGAGINTFQQYLIGQGMGTSLSSVNIDMTGYVPDAITSTAKYGNLYAMVLGMVTSNQVVFTRGLGSLASGLPLNPRKSCAIQGVAATSGCLASPQALNSSIIPTYNIYLTDAWHLKPSFTLNYGVGYTLEMPPYETNGGFQSVFVDQSGHLFSAVDYFKNVQQAALQGQSYAPLIGSAVIRNVTGHSKYPYNPFYGGISPRIAFAWNFRSDTVLRGGWSRIYGRINGVDPVLVPLLTPGLMQPDTCGGPNISGGCGGSPVNVFRVGVDGKNAPLAPALPNLPQPWYFGVNNVSTGAGETMDPNFHPDHSDEFTVSLQHQFGPRILASAGYIGRIMKDVFQAYSITAVPYMMTMGGQTFANAWAHVMLATNYGTQNLTNIPVQPFFEAALGNAGAFMPGGFCYDTNASAAYSSCTQAFVMQNLGNMSVSDAYSSWNTESSIGAWNFGRTLPSDPIPSTCNVNNSFGCNGQSPSLATNISNGFGNYNAGYLDLTITGWRGLTLRSNLTMSKSLGTGNVIQASSEYAAVDNWNLHNMYGPQYYDQTFTYNLYFNYAPPFYSDQKGLVGRLLGGWTIAPVLTAGSGHPVQAQTPVGDCGSFGECNPAYNFTYENMVQTQSLSGNYNNVRQAVAGSNGYGTAGAGYNVFSNPEAAYNAFRAPILGYDGQIGGGGVIRGLPFWNVDMGLTKKININEKYSSTFFWGVSNVFNHMQPADPCLAPWDPSSWGVLGCGGNLQANAPRQMQFGLSFDW
jgi:hypothetical protein